jgi:hypothetical protein
MHMNYEPFYQGQHEPGIIGQTQLSTVSSLNLNCSAENVRPALLSIWTWNLGL